MKHFLILCCFFLSVNSFSQEQLMKYSKARIYYKTIDDLRILSQNGVSLDNGIQKKGLFIESDFSEYELNKARKLGLKIEIVIDNMQEFYVERNEASKKENKSYL